MVKFCEDVIKFLQSEYNDGYSFKIERHISLPQEFRPYYNNERVELRIDIGPRYRITIVDESIRYLFKLYLEGEFLEDRKQYLWQKELIAMIEGN
jgi:hypothetical protein